jgi:hypothetical protein
MTAHTPDQRAARHLTDRFPLCPAAQEAGR